MKTNKFLLFSTLLFLTGCSNKTPSQSEINDELVKAFASCKMATIKNVIKNNGEEVGGNNKYLVDVSFDLLFKPVENSKERLAKILEIEKSENLQINEISQKIDSLRSEISSLREQKSNAIEKIQQEFSENEIYQKKQEINDFYDNKISPLYSEEIKLSVKLVHSNPRAESARLKKEMSDEFNSQCVAQSKFARHVFVGGMATDMFSNEKSPLGGEFNLNYKIPMKKTENGWVFDM